LIRNELQYTILTEHNYTEEKLKAGLIMKKAIISDMDGVIYRGKQMVEGAQDFINRLLETGLKFLFLTNNSELTRLDLKLKVELMGIKGLNEDNFITSAMAAATFLAKQKPNASCYAIGGAGLTSELCNAGLSITESAPDYVVVGKTSRFNFDMMKKAVNFIRKGAKFIGTNPDMVDPVEGGMEPACGSILAGITAATGRKPYIIGKPNSLMMLIAKNKLGVRSSETVMIGDRMDTDIVAGIEAGMTTCLVLSGVSTSGSLDEFPYKPDFIFNHVGEIHPEKL